jgi:hypothetical protein
VSPRADRTCPSRPSPDHPSAEAYSPRRRRDGGRRPAPQDSAEPTPPSRAGPVRETSGSVRRVPTLDVQVAEAEIEERQPSRPCMQAFHAHSSGSVGSAVFAVYCTCVGVLDQRVQVNQMSRVPCLHDSVSNALALEIQTPKDSVNLSDREDAAERGTMVLGYSASPAALNDVSMRVGSCGSRTSTARPASAL